MDQQRRRVLSWAFFDWANSAFATVVMAGFFPLFFKRYWAGELAATDSTFWLGAVNSAASLIIVVFAPLLGAVADQAGAKKRFLIGFTVLGVLMSGGLFWLAQGQWGMALAIYLLGILGFSGSNIFYDALLVDVAPSGSYERTSALGYALGYLGGGLLFAFDVLMTLFPSWFGLADSAAAVRASFLSVAIWWALFAVPVALWVPEGPRLGGPGLGTVIRGALRQLADTLSHIRRLPMTFLFLLAYWFYIDGVDTIVRMAVDYGLAIGLDASSLMVALLVTQFIGFPAALVFGRLGERWGAKRSILLAIGIYLLVVLAAARMETVTEFYLLAVAIGLVQGGIQALSRAVFAGLIPTGHTAEFFAFFNMVGKFAAVLGPILVGVTAALTGDSRLSLATLVILFFIGAALLLRVDLQAGRTAVEAFDAEARRRMR
ncbi:MAG: MFS transporter [Pseudomonadota bacterium]|nr:MFS transporter [Pseudomonadota bacterium]